MKSLRRKFSGLLAAALVATLVMFSGFTPAGANEIEPNVGGDCQLQQNEAGITIMRKKPCELRCTGTHHQSIDDAKDSYEAWCGQEWQYDSGFHQCEWQTNGWICAGPKSDATNQ